MGMKLAPRAHPIWKRSVCAPISAAISRSLFIEVEQLHSSFLYPTAQNEPSKNHSRSGAVGSARLTSTVSRFSRRTKSLRLSRTAFYANGCQACMLDDREHLYCKNSMQFRERHCQFIFLQLFGIGKMRFFKFGFVLSTHSSRDSTRELFVLSRNPVFATEMP